MRAPVRFTARDRSMVWYQDILDNHLDQAMLRVGEVLNSAERDDDGCLVTPTKEPRKLRFNGGQDRAYRFVYCITHRLVATRDQVIRHRCHKRCCVNPRHLVIGDRRDNLMDEWDRQANGVDYRQL
ncbi:hypothetical protein A9D60_19525 [Leisingera sp. JC1]|nr:hypothetical protein A9D60_19525 [Leisingera sp. JC1]